MRNIARARAIVVALVAALLAIGTPTSAEAQNAVITGKVLSHVGQPVVGANVYINDLALSSATNETGTYTITIPSARCCGQLVNLRVRAIGFRPELRPIRVAAGTATINFQMQQDVNRLDEIVVTGSIEGTERAKVPFAVGRLAAEDMPVPALDPVRALAGKVSGVRIAQTSGRPGSTPEIMLRGPTSINGTGRGQGPLIIVDGAIMNVGSLEELGGLDIESVEVVKGAAGASLYGTRAANGVITIKTKRGATGTEGIRFNVRSEYGVSDLNSLEYGMPVNHHLQLDETGKRFCVTGSAAASHCSRTFEWNTEIQRINGVNADTVRSAQSAQFNAAAVGGGVGQNVFQAQIWPGQYYNTFAQLASPNPIALTQVDATGRLGAVRFFVSGSYQSEEGAIKDVNGIQQRRGRVNLDYDVRHDLAVSVSSLFQHGTNDLRAAGGSFGTLLRGAPPGTDYARRDTLDRYIIRGGGAGLRGSGNGGGTFLYNNDNDNEVNLRTSYRFVGNVSANYFPAEWVTIEGLLPMTTARAAMTSGASRASARRRCRRPTTTARSTSRIATPKRSTRALRPPSAGSSVPI
jgi:TonB-dependent SusC/RagA subfamily outer membrane receptor